MKFNPEDFWGTKPITHQIGDGKFPNKYWVSYTNDYYYYQDGVYNWASEELEFEPDGKTVQKTYDTFTDALAKANEYIAKINQDLDYSVPPKKNQINTVFVEDRLSGEVFMAGIYYRDGRVTYDQSIDTGYTQGRMKEGGYTFR